MGFLLQFIFTLLILQLVTLYIISQLGNIVWKIIDAAAWNLTLFKDIIPFFIILTPIFPINNNYNFTVNYYGRN